MKAPTGKQFRGPSSAKGLICMSGDCKSPRLASAAICPGCTKKMKEANAATRKAVLAK